MTELELKGRYIKLNAGASLFLSPSLQIEVNSHNRKPTTSFIARLVKNPLAMQETLVQFLGREDPLEKG